MKHVAIFLGLLLMGCGGPGYEYRGLPVTRIAVGKALFDVRVDYNQNRAQAVRRNAQWAPRLGPLGVDMVLAIEQVSGCRVRKLKGDHAVGQAWLSCTDEGPPDHLPDQFECDVDYYYGGYANLRCDPMI